jgi:hypothetical protein
MELHLYSLLFRRIQGETCTAIGLLARLLRIRTISVLICYRSARALRVTRADLSEGLAGGVWAGMYAFADIPSLSPFAYFCPSVKVASKYVYHASNTVSNLRTV